MVNWKKQILLAAVAALAGTCGAGMNAVRATTYNFDTARRTVTGRFKTSHQRAQFSGSKPATDFLSYNVQ